MYVLITSVCSVLSSKALPMKNQGQLQNLRKMSQLQVVVAMPYATLTVQCQFSCQQIPNPFMIMKTIEHRVYWMWQVMHCNYSMQSICQVRGKREKRHETRDNISYELIFSSFLFSIIDSSPTELAVLLLHKVKARVSLSSYDQLSAILYLLCRFVEWWHTTVIGLWVIHFDAHLILQIKLWKSRHRDFTDKLLVPIKNVLFQCRSFGCLLPSNKHQCLNHVNKLNCLISLGEINAPFM